jgi:glycosyltransferase involved in cell wall biosynthesis
MKKKITKTNTVKANPTKKTKRPTIFLHLPAYREPELVPTIKDALDKATYPERLRFGICRQFNEEDGFDNVDEFRKDKLFRIVDIPHEAAKGLPYARYVINEQITADDDYILQLDSHHRFIEGWDEILLDMHVDLEKKGFNPILTGYLPYYNPFNDPAERAMEPWQQQFAAFYPHGTIFIRPGGFPNRQKLTEPVPSRFISGHFAFARTKWALEVKHDADIYFSGEELNLTVRSFTHGYDLFHPHKLVIWHATMREERSGKLIWDDQSKRGEDWWSQQNKARAKIRQMLRTEDNGFDLTGYDIGTVRTIRDYEKYAGIHFAKRSIQKHTLDNKYPPNPIIEDEVEWENSFMRSFYHLVTVHRHELPADDYDSILIAFDDENGIGIHSRSITGSQLENFIKNGQQIHYEEMFMVDKVPSKMVFWGHSKERGWCERTEHAIR